MKTLPRFTMRRDGRYVAWWRDGLRCVDGRDESRAWSPNFEYDPRCGFCWLNIAHTEALHKRKVNS
jgi:hypothetical protein